MTVPTQRNQPNGGDPSLNGIILDTVRQVQQSVDKLAERFDGLGERFMPRTEVTARFEESMRDRTELRSQLAAAKAIHDVDIAKVDVQLEQVKRDAEDAEERRRLETRQAERERVVTRRWQVGTGIAALSAFAGVIGGITIHFH